MKYDLTYTHFLEKRSWFGNSYLIMSLTNPTKTVKNQNGKNGVEIIHKND